MQHKYKFLNANFFLLQCYNMQNDFFICLFFLMIKHGTKKNLAIKLFVFLFFCFNFIKLNKKGAFDMCHHFFN